MTFSLCAIQLHMLACSLTVRVPVLARLTPAGEGPYDSAAEQLMQLLRMM
jgi:hypothetical protein